MLDLLNLFQGRMFEGRISLLRNQPHLVLADIGQMKDVLVYQGTKRILSLLTLVR